MLLTFISHSLLLNKGCHFHVWLLLCLYYHHNIGSADFFDLRDRKRNYGFRCISKYDTQGAKSVSYFKRQQTGTCAYKNLLRVMGAPKSHDLQFLSVG